MNLYTYKKRKMSIFLFKLFLGQENKLLTAEKDQWQPHKTGQLFKPYDQLQE